MNEVKLPTADIQYKLYRVREMAQNHQLLSTMYPHPECSDLTGLAGGSPLDPGRPVNPESVRSFPRCLETLADHIKLEKESLEELSTELDKNPSPSDLEDIVMKRPVLFSPGLYNPNIKLPGEKLQVAKHNIKTAITDVAEMSQMVAELLGLAKQITLVRTGSVNVITTIRNTGDTDGLVLASAEDYLILNKNAAKLPLNLLGQSSGSPILFPNRNFVPVVSIPKRGAVTVELLLDPSVLPEPPRVAVTALLKQSQYTDLKGKVILKDTRNRDVESREFDFPPGPDE